MEPESSPTEEDEVRQEEEEQRHPGPLPADGDQLFKADADPDRVWVEQSFSPQKTYQTGYQWAADYLFQKAQDSTAEAKRAAQEAREGKGDWPDTLPMSIEPWLVYPIYFLYRHVIELALKDLLRVQDHEGWLSPEGKDLSTTSHNVFALWETAKPWVLTFCQRVLGNRVPAFEAMLREIQDRDPNAEAGRFHLRRVGPRKKRVLTASFAGTTPLDLNNFRHNATKLLNFITWVWTLYEEKIQDEEHERWWRGEQYES